MESTTKKEKFPKSAHYGSLEIDDKTYEFMRIRGDFYLRFTDPEGATLKIRLNNVSGGENSYRWLPVEIYYVRDDGNRRVNMFGPFKSNTFIDGITSNKLTSALKTYKSE